MPQTGHKCEQSGIYESSCCKQQIALSKGDTFPPCQECRKNATWVLIRATRP